jgi:hypothetical protein
MKAGTGATSTYRADPETRNLRKQVSAWCAAQTCNARTAGNLAPAEPSLNSSVVFPARSRSRVTAGHTPALTCARYSGGTVGGHAGVVCRGVGQEGQPGAEQVLASHLSGWDSDQFEELLHWALEIIGVQWLCDRLMRLVCRSPRTPPGGCLQGRGSRGSVSSRGSARRTAVCRSSCSARGRS